MSAVESLCSLVATRGEAITPSRIRVDSFLNHRVECDAIDLVAEAAAEVLDGFRLDTVLTAEAGGIAPASAVARRLGLPLVYAKKFQSLGDTMPFFSRRIVSPTRGEEFDIGVSRRVFTHPGNVLIVDDVLAGGTTAEMLGDIAEEAGARSVHFMLVVEKTFQGGRKRLEGRGWRVSSLVPIRSLANGRIEIGSVEAPAEPEPTTPGFHP